MSTHANVSIGEKVVHPHHGVGVVTETHTLDLGAGPVPYVTIEIEGGLTLKVPVGSLTEIGIREPVSASRAEEVLEVLSQPPVEDPGHALRRRRDNERLASGELKQCAEVVRDLTAVIAAHGKGGADADRRLLTDAKEQLASELVVALGGTFTDALARIDELVRSNVADTSDEAAV